MTTIVKSRSEVKRNNFLSDLQLSSSRNYSCLIRDLSRFRESRELETVGSSKRCVLYPFLRLCAILTNIIFTVFASFFVIYYYSTKLSG